MTYSIQYVFSATVLNEIEQKIFAPIIGALNIHSAKLFCNGLVNVTGFALQHPWIYVDEKQIGYKLESTDQIWLEANYFYKTSHGHLLDSIVDSNYQEKDKTKNILSSHFIDGHFSFDNGLYKEAVSNFGTVVEALVNTELKYCRMEKMINNERRLKDEPKIRAKMLLINRLRNRVHPEQISNCGQITREEASKARLALQDILFWFHQNAGANIVPDVDGS